MEVEEGEDDDDDVEIVEHDAVDVAVMQHAAAAPNQAAVPVQVHARLYDGVVVSALLIPLQYDLSSAVAADGHPEGKGICKSTWLEL